MKKIISIFQIISILLGVTVMILFIIPMLVGIKPFVVLSGSMEPDIMTGSVAYVNTHIKPEEIKQNDIIGFSMKNKIVTHRVIRINNDKTFTTKGDANKSEDISNVKFDNYIGKTIFSIPYLGKIVSYSKSKVGIFVIALIVGLNIVFILFEKKLIKEEEY